MADLGKRYATALFELGQDGQLLPVFLEQAKGLLGLLQEEDCKAFITHPRVSSADKINFFSTAFDGKIHAHLMGFLQLAVSKNREDFLLSALQKLVDMIRHHQHQTTARVVSAVPLTQAQLEKLAAVLGSRLGKQVDVLVQVNPAVIGGISVHVDGFFMDHTLRFLLRDMKDKVKETVKRGAAHVTQA